MGYRLRQYDEYAIKSPLGKTLVVKDCVWQKRKPPKSLIYLEFYCSAPAKIAFKAEVDGEAYITLSQLPNAEGGFVVYALVNVITEGKYKLTAFFFDAWGRYIDKMEWGDASVNFSKTEEPLVVPNNKLSHNQHIPNMITNDLGTVGLFINWVAWVKRTWSNQLFGYWVQFHRDENDTVTIDGYGDWNMLYDRRRFFLFRLSYTQRSIYLLSNEGAVQYWRARP